MAKGAGGGGRSRATSRPGSEGLGDVAARVRAIPGVQSFQVREDPFVEGYVELEMITVGGEGYARGEGIGTRAMREFLVWVDRNKRTVYLSPDAFELRDERGYKAASARLERWYRGFGFVPNRGRNKDYRIGGFTGGLVMVRRPRG